MNWNNFFSNLTDEEKDKIAVLRVIECTNGVIQYAHRDSAPYALPIEQTREAMQFSMGCMKRMAIPVGGETITFSKETEEVLREIRKLYVSGVKNGNEEDFAKFMEASKASVQGVGYNRLVGAAEFIRENIDNVISKHVDWGRSYLSQFL